MPYDIDVICILGRGIEKVQTAFGVVWRPTRYIEKLTPEGWHSGYRVSDIDPNDETSVIAGSNANVLAAYSIYTTLCQSQRVPPLVIFTGGHPDYLANQPATLTEGSIMIAIFKRRIALEQVPEPKIITQDKNRDTRDEMVETLRFMQKRQLQRLMIITVEVQIERSQELLCLAQKDDVASEAIKVIFLSSESILTKRDSRFERIFSQARKSNAHHETRQLEQIGVQRIRAGTYDFSAHQRHTSNEKGKC